MKAIPQIPIVRLTAKQADKIQKVYRFLPDNWKDILSPAKTVDSLPVHKENEHPVPVKIDVVRFWKHR